MKECEGSNLIEDNDGLGENFNTKRTGGTSDETNCVHVSTHENRCLIMLLDIKSLLLRLCFMGRDYILISVLQ